MIMLFPVLGLTLSSIALQGDAPAEAQFELNEAAQCAAFFAFTMDAMQRSTGVPRHRLNEVRDGLTIWEYEIASSGRDLSQEDLNAAANRAIGTVRADMPNGNTTEAADARGAYLLDGAAACGQKITVAYAGEPHPVIPLLREAEVAVRPTSTGPSRAAVSASSEVTATPVAATGDQTIEELPRRRGLR